MTNTVAIVTNIVEVVRPHFEGYVYPNEATLQPLWSVLIVLYPYITGLVAGAFIMASLVRVFNVKALEPVYRLSLLTAFAFLLCAPLPLLFHLGHPERCYEVMMTPHLTSPMAIFGFVYAWYLMAVLLLELWFDYRHDFVVVVRAHARVPGTVIPALYGRRDRHLGAGGASWITKSAMSSPSSAFPRPSCCTAMWDSSSGRSKPTPGGATPSCRSSSLCRRWCPASRCVSSTTWS